MKKLNGINLEDFISKAYDKMSKSKDSIEIPALKECERSMKQRIHNKGTDSDGNRIGLLGARKGLYSPGYAAKKAKISGDNLYPINLQLEGDLIKGYTVGRSGGKNVLQFQDDFSKKKAGYAEENYKVEIFKPSAQELEDVKEVFLIGFEEALRDSFGNL